MKNFVAAFLLVLVSNSLCAKVNESEVYYFVKVWGILKYYHPEIQKGKPDWDSAFINGIAAAFENASNDRFLSIEKLIQAAGNQGRALPDRSFTSNIEILPIPILTLIGYLTSNSQLPRRVKRFSNHWSRITGLRPIFISGKKSINTT
jgi:hypothetical protein